jgi:hypothetical protein
VGLRARRAHELQSSTTTSWQKKSLGGGGKNKFARARVRTFFFPFILTPIALSRPAFSSSSLSILEQAFLSFPSPIVDASSLTNNKQQDNDASKDTLTTFRSERLWLHR